MMFHDMYPQQFEDCVLYICREILGIGTQNFSVGRDGGRDAVFTGTANYFPSKSKPASGKFIIQAKHTSDPVAKCSENNFQKVLIDKEIPKIKRLYEKGEMDYYLLFTNRRLGADSSINIKKKISSETGLLEDNIYIIGIEHINTYIKPIPDIFKKIGINCFEMPMRIDWGDLSEVIIAFNRYKENIKDDLKELSNYDSEHDFDLTELIEKNEINGLSEDLFKYIKKEHNKYFGRIESFLNEPRNQNMKQHYHETADTLKAKLIIYEKDYSTFDQALEYIYDQMIERDSDIKKHKFLARTFLYYMYWNCDMGKKSRC